jgi:hypothetical protein
MSTPITRTAWAVLDAKWVDTDPECDVIAVELQANGKNYSVACSGPKNMKSNEFISAMYAAAAGLIRASGNDLSSLKVVDDSTAQFDTGDQRAN